MNIVSVLVEAMSGALDRSDVTDESSIFGLGGTSMHAEIYARMVSSSLGVAVTFSDVFDHPTPIDLADALAARSGEEASISLSDPKGPHPTTVSQARRLERVVGIDPREATFAGYPNLIVVATRLQGRLDVPALRRAVVDVSSFHDALRGAFAYRNGEWQLVLDPVPIELTTFPPGTSDDSVEAAVWAPFNYEVPGLARFVLAQRSHEDHSFYVAIEHIVGDGESARILMEDLTASYNAHHAGRAPRLGIGDATIRGYELGHLERRDLESSVGREAIDYWRAEYGVYGSSALALPGLRPNDFDPSVQDAYLGEALSATVADRLRHLARSMDATLHVLMVWALARAVADVTGESDVTIHWFVAGRGRPEVERMVNSVASMSLLRLRAVPDAVDADTLRVIAGRIAKSNALSRFRVVARPETPREERAARLFLHVNPDPLSGAPLGRTWVFDGLHAAPLVTRPQGRPRGYSIDASLRFDGATMILGIAWRAQMLEQQDAQALLDAFVANAEAVSQLAETE